MYAVPERTFATSTEAADRDEGHRLFVTRGCVDCHGEGGAGRAFLEDPGVGTYRGANLTPGRNGLPADYSPEAFHKAVRHGVRRDGTPLVFMPSQDWFRMSDVELARLYAYVRSLPAVDTEPVVQEITPLARVLTVAVGFPLLPAEKIDHEKRYADVPAGPTKEYGEVLSLGCTGCHGNGLSGGPIPGAPSTMAVPTNITPDKQSGIGSWTRDQFEKAMREGVRPDGTRLDPFMPVAALSRMTDDEVTALHAYLSTVPAKPFGGR